MIFNKNFVDKKNIPTITQIISQLAANMSNLNAMERSAMATPPTITFQVDNGTPTITNPVFYPITDDRIRKTRALDVNYNNNGRNVYAVTEAAGLAPAQGSSGTGCTSTFCTDAPQVEIDIQAQPSTTMAILIDGERILNTSVVATGGGGNVRKITKLDFTTKRLRRFTLNTGSQIAGIYINNNFGLQATANTSLLSLFSIADSYGGDGYYGYINMSTDQDLAHAIGYENYAHSAIGGTGYVNPNTATPIAVYIDRLKKQVNDGFIPSVLLTMGGINDNGNFTDKQKVDAINAYYSYVKDTMPNSLIISTGPWAPSAAQVISQPHYKTNNNAIKAALIANGLNYIFLDTLNGGIYTSWGTVLEGNQYNLTNTGKITDVHNNPNAVWTGSGTVSADGNTVTSATPGVGIGNTFQYIKVDGTHPTGNSNSSNNGLDCGRFYLSKWLYNSVRQAVLMYVQ